MSIKSSNKLLFLSIFASFSISNTNAASFINDFGLSDPHISVTFSEHVFPDSTTIASQFSDVGVSFNDMLYNNSDSYIGISYPSHFDGAFISNFAPMVPNLGFIGISFNSIQNEVAFAIATANGGTTQIDALLLGNVVETLSVATGINLQNNFVGFSGINFDSININTVSTDGAIILDNLQIASVPEPTSLVLLAAGFLGFSVSRRKVNQA